MTHAELKTKIEENLPFTLHVADGREIRVPHRDFVWLPPRSSVVIIAEEAPDNSHETITRNIPLLMISGVTQRTSFQNGA